MSTPISNTNPYASVQDFILRFDIRDVSQWLSDTGSPVTQASLTTPPPAPQNATLTAMLAEASGRIEAACLVSDRYTPNDLLILTNNSLALLKGITCDLVIERLRARRIRMSDWVIAQYEEALQWLEWLREGKRIFALQEAGDAGNPLITFTSQADIALRNPVSLQMYRLFADRGQYFVPGSNNIIIGSR